MVRAKLPDYHFVLGVAFFTLGLAAKNNLPRDFGSLPIIQLPSAFFSAVFIPFGAYLALRALIFSQQRRRTYVSIFLFAWLFLVLLLAEYFFARVVVEGAIGLGQSPTLSRVMLPKVIESSHTLAKADQREKMAAWAYKLSGVIIAYQRDDGQLVYYVPTEADKTFRQKQEKFDDYRIRMVTFLQKQNTELGYLFLLYASTYLTAFLIGWVWLMVKIPTERVARS